MFLKSDPFTVHVVNKLFTEWSINWFYYINFGSISANVTDKLKQVTDCMVSTGL